MEQFFVNCNTCLRKLNILMKASFNLLQLPYFHYLLFNYASWICMCKFDYMFVSKIIIFQEALLAFVTINKMLSKLMGEFHLFLLVTFLK